MIKLIKEINYCQNSFSNNCSPEDIYIIIHILNMNSIMIIIEIIYIIELIYIINYDDYYYSFDLFIIPLK